MKKLLLLALSLSILSCGEKAPKDYVSFSGTITNQNSDSIVISTKGFSKTIKVNADGTFSDTLKVTPGIYRFYDGGEYTRLFLRNGYDLIMELDTEMFDQSIKY
ncbi:MAG: thioredoxin, partial [Flavobacteriaceae bacterium]|nr:thioredoxin [Flavobacteriaceae bacterium]